jgi:hypothetical protein
MFVLQTFGLHFSLRWIHLVRSLSTLAFSISVCLANSEYVFNRSFMNEPTLSTP